MKLLLAAFVMFSCALTFSQQSVYSYSFSGAIDSSFVKELESESMTVKGVSAAKAKYKIDKQKGEIIIYALEERDEKDPYVFSPSSIKAILIRHGLKPGQFIELQTSK